MNVRVVVATHRDLEKLVKENAFRQDLFHRIYVFPLRLPALRERKEDFPALIAHFARQVAAQTAGRKKNSMKPLSRNCSVIAGREISASCVTWWSV